MSESAPAPQWADSSRGLGRWIERSIGIRLLRRPLFFQARQLIIRTAERNGIPWRKRRSELREAAAPLRGSGSPRLLPSALPCLRAGQPLLAGRSGGGASHRCDGLAHLA